MRYEELINKFDNNTISESELEELSTLIDSEKSDVDSKFDLVVLPALLSSVPTITPELEVFAENLNNPNLINSDISSLNNTISNASIHSTNNASNFALTTSFIKSKLTIIISSALIVGTTGGATTLKTYTPTYD